MTIKILLVFGEVSSVNGKQYHHHSKRHFVVQKHIISLICHIIRQNQSTGAGLARSQE